MTAPEELRIEVERKPPRRPRAEAPPVPPPSRRIGRTFEPRPERFSAGSSSVVWRPSGGVPDCRELALVLGGADCVWRDLAALETLIGGPWPGLVVVVNDLGNVWPRRVDAWASVHPEKLLGPIGWRDAQKRRHGWLGQRLAAGLSAPRRIFTTLRDSRYSWVVDGEELVTKLDQWASGSSGLFAVRAAYELGARRVVLAGVPMDARAHFVESTVHKVGKPWASSASHRRAWTDRKVEPRLRERTRSLSGWTREHFGAPTLRWLTS